MGSISDLREPQVGRLPGGGTVRLRPAPGAGRWLLDAWGPDGTRWIAGRPVAVGSDGLSVATVRGGLGALVFSGDSDPLPGASLDAQGIGALAENSS